MTIQTLPGGAWVPRDLFFDAAPAMTFLGTLSASGGKSSFLFQAPKAGNIRKLVWGTRQVTTGTTLDVRLETVDTSVTPSVPSGTLFGTNTNGSQVVNSSDDNVVFATTLTADATVTRGAQMAFVLANSGSGNMQVPACLSYTTRASAYPYGATYNGTTWTATIAAYGPMLAVEYDDGSYYPIAGMIPPTTGITTTTINTGTTPDVAGLRFQLAFPARVNGCWWALSGGGDYKVMLVSSAYNQGAGTGILASATFDKDTRASTPYTYYFSFDSQVSLSANTAYRLLIEPQTATSVSIYSMALQSLAQMDAWEGGQNFCLTTAKDPTGDGSWTNSNSGTFAVPFCGLWLDGFDDATGGGATEHSHVFVG